MKLYRLFTVTAATVALASTALAQGKGAGVAKAPHVATSSPKGGAQTHAPKAGTSTGGGKSASAASSRTSTTTKTKTSTARGSRDKSTRTASTATSSTSTTTTESGATVTTSAGATTTPETAPPNAVSLKIGKNPAQLAKIQPRLDAMGLTLEQASAGFRNQGQFIAALNASTNRNLDFVALQEAMTVDGLSLGQAAKKVANTPPPPAVPPTDGGSGTGSTSTGSGQAQ